MSREFMDGRFFDDGTGINSQVDRVAMKFSEGEGDVINNNHFSDQTGHLLRGAFAKTTAMIQRIVPDYAQRGLPVDLARTARRSMRRTPSDGKW